MHSSIIRDKLLHEIERLPDEKLSEVYHFIYDIRLKLENSEQNENPDILSFSGSWQNMEDCFFNNFLADMSNTND